VRQGVQSPAVVARRRQPPELLVKENFSSSLTVLYKFVLPAVWPAGFGLATLALFSDPRAPTMRWGFAAGWLLGTALLWCFCAPLKYVEVDGATLVISNFWRQIRVPLHEVESVWQSESMRPPLMRITFKQRTPFGRSVRFMPPMADDDRTLERLQHLLAAARAA
jgi:hypothetical protein